MRRPSADYWAALEEAKKHHSSSKTYSGKFLRPHAPAIKGLIDRLGCRTVLDYGCGKGNQYSWVSHGEDASIPKGATLQSYWGMREIFLYDPAVPAFSTPPGLDDSFDLVICTHALGSIPIEDLSVWVVPALYSYANKAVYIAEKLGPVGKQVFSAPELMPRNWSREDWRAMLSSIDHEGLQVELATHERIGDQKIVTRANIDQHEAIGLAGSSL